MFLTALEDFDYKPCYKDGELVRGKVVTQSTLVWRRDMFSDVAVPAGFVTDLASLPWFTSLLFKKLGKSQRAAVLHDYLYKHRVDSKTWADRQFLEAMRIDGVKRWRRNSMWLAVSVFGFYAWNRNKKSEVEIVE